MKVGSFYEGHTGGVCVIKPQTVNQIGIRRTVVRNNTIACNIWHAGLNGHVAKLCGSIIEKRFPRVDAHGLRESEIGGMTKNRKTGQLPFRIPSHMCPACPSGMTIAAKTVRSHQQGQGYPEPRKECRRFCLGVCFAGSPENQSG